MSVVQHRGVELRAKRPGAPHFLGRTGAECEERRAFAVSGRDKHFPTTHDRIGGIDAILGHPRSAPRLLAVDGVDREVRFRGAQQHEHAAVEFNRKRRGVTGVLIRRLPQDFPRGLIEGHSGFADVQNQSSVEHEGRAGEAPVGDGTSRFLLHIYRPNNLSGGGLETERIAPAAQRVEPTSVERGRASGAAFEKLVAQLGGVAVFPNWFSRDGLEAKHRILPIGVAHREDAPVTDHERRCAEADRSAPRNRRTRSRPLIKPAFLGGNSRATGAAPLGPVGRLGRRTENGQQDHARPEAHQEERVFETHRERGD